MASPLVWRDAGNPSACHVAGRRFQDVFEEAQKWLRPSGEMFRRGRLHETEITESLIAISQRRKLGRGLDHFRKEGRRRQPPTPDMPEVREGPAAAQAVCRRELP